MKKLIYLCGLILMFTLACESRHPALSASVAALGDSLIQHINQICLTDPEKALALLDSAEANHLLKTYDINGLRAVIYQNAFGQSHVALAYSRRIYESPEAQKDTVILAPTLKLQEATGQTSAALASARQIIALKDSLFARENEQKTIEMAAIYKTEDKALQIEQQNIRLQHGRIVLQFTWLLLFVACVVIALIVRYNLLIRKKNRAAVATIHELMAVKGKWTERTDPQLSKQPSDPSQPPTDTIQRLMKRIEEEELFRDANFSRNEAIALVPGLSLKNFSLQFNKCVGSTFPRYLNNLRLEYSLGLLRSTANYSIEGIALDSGFSCRQTYHRLFVERFGLTPTEYRNAEEEEDRQRTKDQSEA